MGAAAAAALLLVLAGCAAPMGATEAQSWARRGLTRFCHAHPCERVRMLGAQQVGRRWLVDFDSPARRYTVAVDEGGNTQVTIWDKPAPG